MMFEGIKATGMHCSLSVRLFERQIQVRLCVHNHSPRVFLHTGQGQSLCCPKYETVQLLQTKQTKILRCQTKHWTYFCFSLCQRAVG